MAACPPPGGNPPPEVTLAFEQATVRTSKLLVSTNGNADQTYTNTLRANGTPVTAGVTYRISAPAGYRGPISVAADGTVRFGKAAYDKVTADGPQTVTVQAAYQGKTAGYTFTLTDHFSKRSGHTSVVMGNDIYVGLPEQPTRGSLTMSYVPESSQRLHENGRFLQNIRADGGRCRRQWCTGSSSMSSENSKPFTCRLVVASAVATAGYAWQS